MKLSKKGFTFVEILGVIVILGILTSVAIIGVSRYQDRARQNDYDALARSSYNGMEEYLGNHPSADTISLDELEEGQYISTLVDPATKNSKCSGAVTVNKEGFEGDNTTLSDYQYTVYLCCANYKKKYTYPDGDILNIPESENGNCQLRTKEIDDDDVTGVPAEPGALIKCNAGKYLPKGKNSCATCTNAHYCPGGSWSFSNDADQGLEDCPTGYKNSAAGSSEITQCFMKVPNGNYVANAKDPSSTACGSGKYKAAHNVFYNSKSTCTNCPSGYGNSAAGSSKNTDCFMNVPKNKYVKKEKDTNATACPTGKIKEAHKVYYTKTSTCSNSKITCAAGKYLPKAKTTCAACTEGSYCKGGTFNYSESSNQGLTPCPTGYKNSVAGSSKNTQCYMKVSAGNHVATKNASSAVKCGSGTYKVAHNVYYSNTSSCTNCPAGYGNSPAASTKESDCYMNVADNKYVKTAKASSATACGVGYTRKSHTVKYGNTSSCNRNFTCAAEGSTVTYMGKKWYVNANNGTYCSLAMIGTVGSNVSYNDADTKVYNLIKSFSNGTNTLKQEKEAGLVDKINTDSGSAKASSISGYWWYGSGKVYYSTAVKTYDTASCDYYFTGSASSRAGVPKKWLCKSYKTTATYSGGESVSNSKSSIKYSNTTLSGPTKTSNYYSHTVNEFKYKDDSNGGKRVQFTREVFNLTTDGVWKEVALAKKDSKGKDGKSGCPEHGGDKVCPKANSTTEATKYHLIGCGGLNKTGVKSGKYYFAGGTNYIYGENSGPRTLTAYDKDNKYNAPGSDCEKIDTYSVSGSKTVSFSYRPHIRVKIK